MNRPLHIGCPACGGTGKVSWLRSGVWINKFCPGTNGPVDVDSAPCGHELDNLHKKRFIRFEYKRNGEALRIGQRSHIEAWLKGYSFGTWLALWMVVYDESQTKLTDEIRFQTYGSWQILKEHERAAIEIATVERLAKKIHDFIWPPMENAYLPASIPGLISIDACEFSS